MTGARRPDGAPRGPAVLAALVAGALGLGAVTGCERADVVVVGSKKFTESVVLGELVRALGAGQGRGRGRGQGARVEHRAELGGTRVLFEALRAGDVDIYPEYTGTLRHELFAAAFEGASAEAGSERLAALLAAQGLAATAPLAFNNTYGLAVRAETAERLGLSRIGDLAAHPGLRVGMGHEFLERADGWRGLAARYGLPHQPAALDHDLAYEALAAGRIDVMDVYTTDAEVAAHGLVVLDDDQGYFPEYRLVFLYRAGLAARAPALLEALSALAGRVDDDQMRRANARVKIEHQAEAASARALLAELGIDVGAPALAGVGGDPWSAVAGHTLEHLALVGVSLCAAILFAIPLGVLAARRRRLGQAVLAACGVVQTVPSLALLVFMIPLLGIGAPAAIAALFLYSLLPIVRNTHAGLVGIPEGLRRSADALGLSARARLLRVDLPLALPSVLAGIQTAAVINVGTATLGALVGAGGYGRPILTGIRLADTSTILSGAVPAAALALLVQGAFALVERRVAAGRGS